ncbi:MAG: hypothetical protein J5I94_29010 [Phaeodactylibacter sp.]|nr:hypothetical protein [Phaeodactylibacter sp.]
MKFPTVVFLLLTLVGGAHCQPVPADDIPPLDARGKTALQQFQNLPAACRVYPAPENEPGAPLIICGTLLRKENRRPVPDASIFLYHTDARGDYRQSEKNRPETSRISGTVKTDERGRFLLSTILPGKYNNQGEGGHIHLQVEGAQPGGYTFQFSQYSSPTDKRFINSNDQFFLVELSRDGQGRLVGFLELPVKGM